MAYDERVEKNIHPYIQGNILLLLLHLTSIRVYTRIITSAYITLRIISGPFTRRDNTIGDLRVQGR